MRPLRITQWRDARCPIRTSKFITAAEWTPLRRRVQDLAWADLDTLGLEGFTHKRLTQLVRSFPNLTGLSLTTSLQHPDSHLLTLLRDVDAMEAIKRLSLDMLTFVGELPLRSRRSSYEPVTIAEEEEQEEEEEQVQVQDQEHVWELTNLKIPRNHLGLLRRCPELRRLQLTARPTQFAQSSIRSITACLRLQELHFVGRMAFRIWHFQEVIRRLENLACLKMDFCREAQFSQLEVLEDRTVAARLKTLHVNFQSDIALETVGMAPQEVLQSFSLRGIAVQPLRFFVAMGRPQTETDNLRTGLQDISIEIAVTAEESKARSPRQQWRLTYFQLSRMVNLHSIVIESRDLDRSKEASFANLRYLTKLDSLALINPMRSFWST
ncbi:hypothetical protein BGX29_008751 [Mortierella sp. GBA35]|nr:hypothetical protein BGX29_008751 [Mortierella sp. GBA35]